MAGPNRTTGFGGCCRGDRHRPMILFIQAQGIKLVLKTKNCETVTALGNFSREIGKREFVSIVGLSRGGKNTSLNILLN